MIDSQQTSNRKELPQFNKKYLQKSGVTYFYANKSQDTE